MKQNNQNGELDVAPQIFITYLSPGDYVLDDGSSTVDWDKGVLGANPNFEFDWTYLSGLRVDNMDAPKLPQDASVDAIWCSRTSLEIISKDALRALIGNLERTLRVGGVFFIQLPSDGYEVEEIFELLMPANDMSPKMQSAREAGSKPFFRLDMERIWYSGPGSQRLTNMLVRKKDLLYFDSQVVSGCLKDDYN